MSQDPLDPTEDRSYVVIDGLELEIGRKTFKIREVLSRWSDIICFQSVFVILVFFLVEIVFFSELYPVKIVQMDFFFQ